MKSSYKTVFLLFAICLMNCSFLFAFETPTHEIINEYIFKNDLNGFSLGIYLKNELGFSKGVYEEFESKQTPLKNQETRTVWEWAKKGGRWEDIPPIGITYTRSVNHYHNPLTGQGFSGIWNIPFLFSGESAVEWSQKPSDTQYPFGHYSWHDARDYFYNALTSADSDAREDNFTDTFRGIGQLMHLVSDMAVPSHTRNDGHYFFHYEKWVDKKIKDGEVLLEYSPFVFFDTSGMGEITPLFDTGQYDGSNPEITLQPGIGLSEYSNANFFSDDTIYDINFPYPYSYISDTRQRQDRPERS